MSAVANAVATVARYYKVSASGLVVPKSAVEWEGVYVPALQIIVSADVLPCGRTDFKKANAAAVGAALCGGKTDRALSKPEYNYIIEDDRFDPAVDPEYFRGPYAGEWTSTQCAPADYAWYVYLGDGNAYRFRQSNRGRVRGVCAGQSLDLGQVAA